MKKFSLILLLITLIFFTAFIKNSTKRIDDQIFTVKENIRSFKKIFENIKLEFDYLSSAEKLLEFQDLYFEDKLINKDTQKIKIMDLTSKELKLMQFDLAND